MRLAGSTSAATIHFFGIVKDKPSPVDAELILPRKRDGFRDHAHHAFGIRHEAEDFFLKIQRQKRRFWGSSFMRYSFLYLGGKLS